MIVLVSKSVVKPLEHGVTSELDKDKQEEAIKLSKQVPC